MRECVFCEIVAGKGCATFLETDAIAVVILDRNQAAQGHMLVMPKDHVVRWHELTDDAAAHLGRLARKWAGALNSAFTPEGYNIVVNNGPAAGQDVFHLHLHITPRTVDDGYYSFGGKKTVITAEESMKVASRLLDGLR